MPAHQHFDFMKQELNEKQWRHFLASESLRIGHGGINQIMQQSGADWRTIKKGMQEIQKGDVYYPGGENTGEWRREKESNCQNSTLGRRYRV